MNEFCLSKAEKETVVWLKLKAHFEERLEEARKENDKKASPEDTAHTRGRITELKRFLALDTKTPPSIKTIDA